MHVSSNYIYAYCTNEVSIREYCVGVFTSIEAKGRERNECPWRLNGEDTERMYSKHISV